MGNKVFDYAGNEIKAGDEFALIQIIQKHAQFGYIVPSTGKQYLSEKKPDEECFKIYDYHKVIVQEETMNELG